MTRFQLVSTDSGAGARLGCILTEHGEVEFGSPMRPMSAEAILVHFIDNLDSRLKIVEEALQAAEPDGFSAYNKWLGGRAFAGFGAFHEEKDHD